MKLGDPRIADSSSINAVSFSSARTMKRFPSPRCASAIEMVRPSRSKAATQLKFHPAFLEVVGDDFLVFHTLPSSAFMMKRATTG
jgi:hypothetical protein